MIENIRGVVRDKKQGILDEQESLRKKIQELNSDIEVLDQIKTALSDDEYFMKITPNDAFGLLEKLGYTDKNERLDVYMKLVSSDEFNTPVKEEVTPKIEIEKPVVEEKVVETKEEPETDFSFDSFNEIKAEEPKLEETTIEEPKIDEVKETPVEEPVSKYQKYIDKITNPTEELNPNNEQLMNSCMQAINESVLSDSNSYFLGDITIKKSQVMDNMKKLFAGNVEANDVLPMLTVGMSYGTTSDETIMDEILDYLKALQVKAN